MPTTRPVILSGGSGTRLWPVSTPALPKQFADVTPDGSLFSKTLRRLEGIAGLSGPIIVTGADHASRASSEAKASGAEPFVTIVEPAGRNTAPAVFAAALVSADDDVLIVLPSDHLIDDEQAFRDALDAASKAARGGAIVTFGIAPTRLETGYGYIEMGEELGPGSRVERFHEKPDHETATRFLESGNHVWNSGMFVGTAKTFLQEAESYAPTLLAGVVDALTEPVGGVVRLDESFADVQAISLDYAVMERTERGIVMPLDIGWTDVGSFAALWELGDSDDEGNVVSGDVEIHDVSNSLIRSTTKPVAVLGVNDVVVVETDAGVLVVSRERAQDVKNLDLDFD